MQMKRPFRLYCRVTDEEMEMVEEMRKRMGGEVSDVIRSSLKLQYSSMEKDHIRLHSGRAYLNQKEVRDETPLDILLGEPENQRWVSAILRYENGTPLLFVCLGADGSTRKWYGIPVDGVAARPVPRRKRRIAS